ncbi:MAG: ABC transporter permease [Candidatus Pristimantibacillus sp.]
MIAIVSLTWKELLRKRVTLMTIIMSVIFWIALWFISGAITGNQTGIVDESSIYALIDRFQQSAIILSLGFFFGAFAIAFLAIFSSVAAVSGEAEHGVLQSVLARPLPRWKWFLGRWLGFTVFGIAYSLLMFISIILITWMQTGLLLEINILLKSFLLFTSVVPLLVSLTMLGSCWLSPLGNGIGMTMLFGMGWLGSMINRVMGTRLIHEDGMETLETITGIITLIMPADSLQQRMLAELFSVANFAGTFDLGGVFTVVSLTSPPSNLYLVYATLYTLLAIIAGLWVMKRKNF